MILYIYICYHNFHPSFQLSLNIKLLVSLFICSNFIAIDRYCLQLSCLSSISSIKKRINAYHEHMTLGATKKEANANLTIYNAFNPIEHNTFQNILSILTNLIEFESRSNIF